MNQYELYHHGIKGMKWGVRKKYEPHPRKKSRKREEEPQQRRKGLTDKQKKYIKIGVGIAATALVAYGSYRLYKSGKLDNLISKGKAALQGSPDEVNIGGFSTKPKPKSVEEAIKGLNRHRGTNQSKNCTFTTVASELSFRGFNIEAKGSTGQHVMGGVIENAFKNAKVYDVGNSKFRTKEAITKSLLKRFPEGSRGAISVQWDPKHLKSGQTGIGHAFNWMIEDGKVRFFDSQTGATDVEKYFKVADKTQMMSYARLDNLEINFDGIKDYVMNKNR